MRSRLRLTAAQLQTTCESSRVHLFAMSRGATLNLLRCCGPQRAGDLVLRAEVERAEARNVASQIAFEVSDRRARGTVVPTGPDSFLSSEMNAQAEG